MMSKKSKTKYETVSVNDVEITVDISLLSKSEEMFFNATDISRPFGKRPGDFLKTEPAQEYIEIVLSEMNSGRDLNHFQKYEDLVKIKKGGKYQGTWFHNELAFEFAGWCSAQFRRKLHKWAEHRLTQERTWKRDRLEAKTGFLPMTDAVLKSHDPIMHYHFSNEADLINRIALGMPAKKFRQKHGVESVRDALNAVQLKTISKMQIINTGLIEIGVEFQARKKHLFDWYNQNQPKQLEMAI